MKPPTSAVDIDVITHTLGYHKLTPVFQNSVFFFMALGQITQIDLRWVHL